MHLGWLNEFEFYGQTKKQIGRIEVENVYENIVFCNLFETGKSIIKLLWQLINIG